MKTQNKPLHITRIFGLLISVTFLLQVLLISDGADLRIENSRSLSAGDVPAFESPVEFEGRPALSYPPDPTSNISWSTGTSGVADIQAAFNHARTVENNQLGIFLPMLTLPSQTQWNGMSDGEKALWLINRERIDRGIAPLHGLETNVNGVAQYYADYLLAHNTWGHSADGRSPWERLEDNPAIGACHDFLSIAENLAVFATSGSSIPLPIERSIYMWMYEDCCSSAWGHRHAILWYPYNDNSGQTGREGFLGIGRANGGPYKGPFSQSWPFAELIVMNVFDPCADWSYPDLVVTEVVRVDASPTNADSVRFDVIFSKEVAVGVNQSDFSLHTSGVSGAAITNISGSGATYTVTVTTGSGNGKIRLDVVDDDSVRDASNNPLGGVGLGNGNFSSGEVYDIKKMTLPVGSQDGWILESSEISGAGGSLNKSAAVLRVGDDAANRQYRAILSFDTPILPEGAVIASVTLKFKHAGVFGNNPFKTHGKLLVDICKGPFKGNAALELGDFKAACGKNKVLIYTSSKVDNWYSQPLNPLDFQFINLGGVTQFRLRFARDDNNDFGADFLKLHSGNAKEEADRPQLIIEYYVP